MNRKLIMHVLTVGIFLILINIGLMIASLVGSIHYYPIFQTIGLALLVLYGFDMMKYSHAKSIYLWAGILFIVFGVFFK